MCMLILNIIYILHFTIKNFLRMKKMNDLKQDNKIFLFFFLLSIYQCSFIFLILYKVYVSIDKYNVNTTLNIDVLTFQKLY